MMEKVPRTTNMTGAKRIKRACLLSWIILETLITLSRNRIRSKHGSASPRLSKWTSKDYAVISQRSFSSTETLLSLTFRRTLRKSTRTANIFPTELSQRLILATEESKRFGKFLNDTSCLLK